jgi:hypothetical protein
MASYYLFLKDEKEFYQKLGNKDPDIIFKMAKAVIGAAKRGRERITVFEVTFKSGDELIFNIEKEDYVVFLRDIMGELVKMDTPETYLMCAEILKLSKPKRKYTKNVKLQT